MKDNSHNLTPSRSVIFIDTSAIVAIINKNDQYHLKAKVTYAKLHEIGVKFLLTNFVIAETHNFLIKHTDPNSARNWLLNSAYQDFNVARPASDIEKKAIREIERYQDKDYSLTDMLSFLIMKLLKIDLYFAYDRHFKQFGEFKDASIFRL